MYYPLALNVLKICSTSHLQKSWVVKSWDE